MGTEVWYLRPWLWLQRLAAGIGWLLFVWGTGYKGFVCDHADMDPLPCDLWWQEQDAGEGKQEIHLVFDGPPEHVAGCRRGDGCWRAFRSKGGWGVMQEE